MGCGKPFKILALDGGGVRGIYSAHLLARMEQSFGFQINTCFDLIAGTSTGSIVAGAAAIGIPMPEIVQLFESEAPHIFPKKWHCLSGLFRSKYSTKRLKTVLEKHLPETTLGQIPTPLMITSSDITTGGIRVFKSSYMEKLGKPYYRDKEVRLRYAILASCAAPSFFDPFKVDNYLLADGGLWANNPSILCLTEALSKFKKSIDEVKILSIGTGHSENMYMEKPPWGILTGWGKQKLVSYVMAVQSQASTNMAKLILGEKYLRLDSAIEDTWGLDNVEPLDNLKALADRDFTHRADDIKAFIGIGEIKSWSLSTIFESSSLTR